MNDITAAGSESVRVGWDGGVATLVVDRPPVNALSSGVLLELRAAVAAVAAAEALRCVVLTGAGTRCFVAGADVREAAATPPEDAPLRTASGQALMASLESLPVPVIVAVNGLCLGGGCELAMAGDVRIAADHARFGQPEIRLGIMPGFGGTQRLPRLIGQGAALDLLLTGRDIPAAEALRLGLVSRVVAGEQLAAEAQAIAAVIAGYPPAAVRAIKSAVRDGGDLPLGDALGLESRLSAEVRMTPDAIEGLHAFAERRQPHWS